MGAPGSTEPSIRGAGLVNRPSLQRSTPIALPIAVLLLVVAGCVSSPHIQVADVKTTTITWHRVENPHAICSCLAPGQIYVACALYQKDYSRTDIFTAPDADNWVLGYEMRRAFGYVKGGEQDVSAETIRACLPAAMR